jgi:tetratricopeptide (TPR) repeat protein
MSTGGKRQNWKRQQQNRSAAPVETDERISARPPNEKVPSTMANTESKYAMPDRDKENELSRLQVQIQELHKSGDFHRASKLSETLVKDTVAHFGDNHPASAAAYNNCGLMRKLLGQFDEARQDYVKSQEIYRSVLGSDHASYANALHNLGNLNRTQIHLDTTLSATDRLSLVESALRYLQEAHTIRLAELGPAHPHTVSSRSSWGATLAAQILHHHKVTAATSQSGDLMRKRFYVAILPTDVTETAWVAAEEHLREAFSTAIQNPRGLTIAKAKESASAAALKSPPPRGKRKVKPSPHKGQDVGKSDTSPQTLSAAAAAQNLAVFLKARATTIQPYEMKWLEEAEMLYRQVLTVQNALLPKSDKMHPDMYATKHSLAELLETMGQKDAADEIRQEMIDLFGTSDVDAGVEPPPNEEAPETPPTNPPESSSAGTTSTAA